MYISCLFQQNVDVKKFRHSYLKEYCFNFSSFVHVFFNINLQARVFIIFIKSLRASYKQKTISLYGLSFDYYCSSQRFARSNTANIFYIDIYFCHVIRNSTATTLVRFLTENANKFNNGLANNNKRKSNNPDPTHI